MPARNLVASQHGFGLRLICDGHDCVNPTLISLAFLNDYHLSAKLRSAPFDGADGSDADADDGLLPLLLRIGTSNESLHENHPLVLERVKLVQAVLADPDKYELITLVQHTYRCEYLLSHCSKRMQALFSSLGTFIILLKRHLTSDRRALHRRSTARALV